MKVALKLSLVGNLVLLTSVGVLLTRMWTPDAKDLQTGSTDTVYLPAPAQNSSVTATSGIFSWRQIESADYRTYVANLRAIGCPEQTTADIIRADVHSLYSRKRAELGLAENMHSGPWSVQEEMGVVAALVMPKPRKQRAGSTPAGETAVLPFVLRDVDPIALHLDQGQQDALAELREQFTRDVGGTNQDPADAVYKERWLQAQPENDRLLRGMIGVNAFMRYQNESQ